MVNLVSLGAGRTVSGASGTAGHAVAHLRDVVTCPHRGYADLAGKLSGLGASATRDARPAATGAA
jgi:hypothetical protein